MSDTFIPTPAYLAPVPKTGAGDISNYTETRGEDGNLQPGVVWPNPRFRDNEDGTVTDYLTGLIWLKNANCAGTDATQEQAFAWVEELNQNGMMNNKNAGDTSNGGTHQRDWRLPNVKELQSLVDYGESDPALPADHPFDNVQSSQLYWSSNTNLSNLKNGWAVYLYDGFVKISDKESGNYVWPVRGGQ